jgi:hypothetical protein
LIHFSSLAARFRRSLILVGAIALGAWGAAHVHLMNPSNGAELTWSESEVSVVIQADGSDDIDDSIHFPALRGAIDAWNGASGNSIALVEDDSPTEQARTDWESSSVHLLQFDESNASGYFPTGSGVVAVTPIFFTSSGRIVDADVLFNGRGFRFTTSGASGAFDIADVATHELGHLLGLDHSGWAGATMYPYVDPRVILHRSLSLDDVHGLRDAYPQGSSASIRGRVLLADEETSVAGAHVVARNSAGRPVASVLTSSGGVFVIRGLDADTYEVYASPIGEPVSAANFGGGWSIDSDFQSTILGSATITDSQLDMEDVFVDSDTSVSLGRASDDYPLRANLGEVTALSIRGTSLSSGGSITCSDPDIDVSLLTELGILIQLTLDVPSNEVPGHVDLMYTSVGGDRSILTAGIELTPRDPNVTIVSPATGSNDGETNLTIAGTGFRAGVRIVIGDTIYEDGVAGCDRIDSETITLTTVAMVGGLHDVVAIDPTGVEGRLSSGFQATATPILSVVFPSVGSSEGATLVHLNGDDFVDGMTATINGVAQSSVSLLSDSEATFQTVAASPGGPHVLVVRNPAGAESSAAFTFLSSPDPLLTGVSPSRGSHSGGTEVTLTGSDFSEASRVIFGADAMTGEGGKAADVVFVDSTTLTATSPSGSAGVVDVVVRDPDTSQASSLVSAFEYEGSSSSGGGSDSIFGGCASIAPTIEMSALDSWIASSWLWIALSLALLRWQSSLRRPRIIPQTVE